jgi:hypothetical protein
MASLARHTGAALRQVGRHAARDTPAGVELELTCEECFEHLDRYGEVELAGRDADAAVRGMRAHLEGCPACHEDHDSLAGRLRAPAAQRLTPGALGVPRPA